MVEIFIINNNKKLNNLITPINLLIKHILLKVIYVRGNM